MIGTPATMAYVFIMIMIHTEYIMNGD